VAANHLLEGHVLIIVDTSPSVVILPTTLFHHLQHAEEYRQSPAVGTFVRWVRFLAVLTSIFLFSLWFLGAFVLACLPNFLSFVLVWFFAVLISIFLFPLCMLGAIDPALLPKSLSFIGPDDEGNIPLSVQIIMALVGIKFLRMAAIHTPTPLATALGLIAAVLIGEIAVDVGMFSSEVILYVSISTIGTYVTPSYELSVANELVNILLVLAAALFGVTGFLIGFVIFMLFLISLKTLETPYLWPFIPFNAKA